MSKSRYCYCAFCRSQKRVYVQRRTSTMDAVLCLMLSSMVTHFIWRSFVDPRGLILLMGLLLTSEMLVQSRWRLSVICQHCGFDPIIYKRSPELASEKVRAKLENRRVDPNYALAKPLNLPTISASKAEMVAKAKADSKGSLVSRSI